MIGFDEPPEERLFKAALAIEGVEREAFIRRAAGDDEELLAAVALLLEGYEDDGGDAAGETILDGNNARQQWATMTEEPGLVLGAFTLIRKIGEGGMGSVWEAEQQHPIARRVALKLIKLGMDTREVVRRFERERQTLAVLDHPNIAHVLEAGSTDLGRPYFVMELVDGVPITVFSEQHGLSIKDRIALMLEVCSGVEHAHRRGVIHRDLKPGNLLVDGDRRPKIIDFGIARAASDEGSTMFTRHTQMLGTPAYMSPEQASGNAAAVETRSDVYSLGVVLYELLAGVPPFDPQRLESSGFAGMQKIINEEEPPKLRATLPKLEFERDLDWIVLKALAKEPRRRYPSAIALADDLRRYLNGEVVEAVPPNASYRFGKFVRRNKLTMGAAVAVFAALLAGLVVSLSLLERAKKQAVRADEARRDSILTVADMQTNNGFAAARDKQDAIARLWFSKATLTARDDPDRAQQNRQRATAWRQRITPPVRAFDPGERFAVEISWNPNPKKPALICLLEGTPRTIRILDLEDEAKVWRPDLVDILSARWSPDGDSFLAISDNSARLISYPEGEELREVEPGEVDLFQTGISLDGESQKFFDQLSPQEVFAIDPQKRKLALAGNSNLIELWALEPRQFLGNVGDPHSQVFGLDFSPDGRFLASGERGLVRVWQVDVPQPTRHIRVDGSSDSVALSSTGKFLAPAGSTRGGSKLKSTRVFEIATGRPVGPSIQPGGDILSAVFSRDDSFLALSVSTTVEREIEDFAKVDAGGIRQPARNHGGRGNLQFWDFREGRRLCVPLEMPSEPRQVVAHPDGRFLAVVCANGETVEVDVATREIRILFKESQPLNLPIDLKHNGALCYSPDGEFLIRYGNSYRFPIWNRKKREFVELEESTNLSRAFGVTMRDDLIVAAMTSAEGKDEIRYLSLKDGRAVIPSQPYPNWPMMVQFDPTGELLLVGGHDKNARVWSWREKIPLGPSLPHFSYVFSGSFLPGQADGIVTGGYGKAIRFWDYRTGFLLRPDLPTRGTLSLELSSDKRWLVACAVGSIIVIDLEAAFPTPKLSPNAALRLAEIDANAEIVEGGGLGRFSSSQWMSKWESFRKDHPDYSGHQLRLEASIESNSFALEGISSVAIDRALLAKLAASTLVTPISVESITSPDPYPVRALISGEGLSSALTAASQIPTTTHGFDGTWVTKDHLPDYFGDPGALTTPVLTFTLAKPTEISAFVHWPYLFSDENPALGNQPSHLRFTFFDSRGRTIGEQIEHKLYEPIRNGAAILSLPKTPGVKTIQLELIDNFFPGNGGDRVGLGEIRFLSGFVGR